MANTRDIKRRIRSIQNTRQITRAMEMVAATKMRRAQAAVQASREYAATAGRIATAITRAGDTHDQPLLASRSVKRTGIVVMTTDRGLAGAMNTNVLRQAAETASAQSGEVTYVAVGRKAETAFGRAGFNLLASFTGLLDNPQYTEVLPIAQVLIDEFTAERLDRVVLVYPQFISTLSNQPAASVLLPAEVPEASDSAPAISALTEFEPSPEAVLESLLPRLLEIQLWQALLETKASEHSSRMLAMRNATNNAGDLLDELRFSFNQARQAAITTEIAEIAAAQG